MRWPNPPLPPVTIAAQPLSSIWQSLKAGQVHIFAKADLTPNPGFYTFSLHLSVKADPARFFPILATIAARVKCATTTYRGGTDGHVCCERLQRIADSVGERLRGGHSARAIACLP